jgi:DNA modification methylase
MTSDPQNPSEDPASKLTGEFAVEWWPTSRPIPYEQNPRLCPESAIAKVAVSIREFGFRQPIVVDESGVIVVGHTRLLAAQRLGLETVPVHVAKDLSPAQARAYRLADNRTNEDTRWNEELLALEIGELAALDYDIDVLGFEGSELAALLEPQAGKTDPDEVPAAPAEPVTQPGDLWLLGPHRLLCGDATKAEDVLRVMGGKRATLMATDPPYLVDYAGGAHPASEANGGAENRDKHWDTYIDHEHSVAFYVDFLKAALDHALTADAAIYEFFAVMRSEVIWQAWRELGLLAHQVVIWKKTRSVLTYSWFLWDYEPLLVGWRQGHQPKLRPPADAKAVWEVESRIEDAPGSVHPTMKPVELTRRPIGYHTQPGGLIYEPFCGSGTALIAAEQTGRICYALEQSPLFVDVAVARWEAFTGKQARRNGARD